MKFCLFSSLWARVGSKTIFQKKESISYLRVSFDIDMLAAIMKYLNKFKGNS